MHLPREKSDGGRVPFIISVSRTKYLEIPLTKEGLKTPLQGKIQNTKKRISGRH